MSMMPTEHPECRKISLREIKSATNNFSNDNYVASGGFGKVYRGKISDLDVAIKRLDFDSDQGDREFWTEIAMLSNFRHKHLVSLLGYCDDNNELILVYEYMINGSLDFNLRNTISPLQWEQRLKICISSARGLNHLHTGRPDNKVIHRDIKSSNILLDENMEAKVLDFGLSKMGPANQEVTLVYTNVAGTDGYWDPAYEQTGILSSKSDVYFFGVVLLEVLSGRPAFLGKYSDERRSLAKLAKQRVHEQRINEIIDENLIIDRIEPNSLMTFIDIVNKCVSNSPEDHPTMAEIVEKLDIALQLHQSSEYQLFTVSGKRYDMLPSKELSLESNTHRGSYNEWRNISVPESRFPDALIFGEIWDVDIKCKIRSEELSPDTTYVAYFVYKFDSSYDGLDGPVVALLRQGSKQSSNQGYWELKRKRTLYLRSMMTAAISDTGGKKVWLPRNRNDGWKEVEVCQFVNNVEKVGEIELKWYGRQSGKKKYGLIIEGIEFRPKPSFY